MLPVNPAALGPHAPARRRCALHGSFPDVVGTGTFDQPEPGRLRCAVIGHPVEHSLSPALHRAAYEALDLPWVYEHHDVKADGVDAFVARLDASWRGLSVTMPNKEAILAHGTPDATVRLAGAANTWVRTPQGPIVRNTDVSGFRLACAARGLTNVCTVTVVGNGATARSSLLAVSDMGVRSVTILARDPRRAVPLIRLGEGLGIRITAQPASVSVPDADLVISTIPVAGSGPIADALSASAPALFDAVYDPWPTPLAEAGQRAGRLVLNGLDLLAGQAVDQVRLMTGQRVTFELLRGAAEAAMAARS